MTARLDCLVIGAGPAGLSAAIYLARFRANILVVEDGKSRATSIPRARNVAGYAHGIAGGDLLTRMKSHASVYGVQSARARIERLELGPDGFTAFAGGQKWAAHTVLLATGVTDHRPRMASEDHDVAVQRGLLRYCPVCDGYEVIDKSIAVIGTGSHAVRETLFVRAFTSQLSLISPDGAHRLSADDRARLAEAGVKLVDGSCRPLEIKGDAISVQTDRAQLSFDSVYAALGSDVHSQLASALGARCAEDGCLLTDAHQRTSVPGLYAAGDVVNGLDQISNAMGQAAVAATAIRNDLASGRLDPGHG